MLNIKSKAFKFLVGTLAVVAFSYASAAMDFGTTTLRVGSKGEAVKAVQTCVGATADGSFGPMTKAKVMAWQSSMGLTADGVFGNMSKAKAATGCTGTTPAPVSQGNCPAGYVAVTPVAPTWAACAMSTTTTTGTNGYLADISSDSTNRVSTVYESEQDKVVAGFRATARLSSQTVTRVRVEFRNTDTGGSSVNLSKYISGASLWMGTTKLATMSVAQADRSTSTDKYTFNFSGLNGMVPQDQIGHFYVSVSANGSLDTNDATNANWAVAFPDGGVSSSSPDGTYDTYNASAGNVGDVTTLGNTGFTFGKFSANGVKAELNLSSSNPVATVLTVQNTSATNGVTLLKFTVKATNSNLTLRKVPIQIVSSSGNVSAKINTIKLLNGTNVVDSLDGSNGYTVAGSITGTTTTGATTTGYLFSNLSSPYNAIASGSTSEFSVVVDLKQVSGNYTEGDTLTASFANADAILTSNFGVLDANGDQLTAGATYRTGSAIGGAMTLRVNGVNVVMGTPTITTTTTTGGVVESATYSIPLTMTAFGQTVYMGQGANLGTVTPGTTGAGAKALSFGFNDSAAPATLISATPFNGLSAITSTLSSTDAQVENLGYRLDSNAGKHFTLQVVIAGGAAATASANYRVALNDVRTWTDNALSAGTSSQVLLPSYSYQTGYQKIK